MPQVQGDNARLIFLLILFLWINAGSDPGPGGYLSAPQSISTRNSRQRDALGVLNSTRWGDFAPRQPNDPLGTAPRYLNLTGFREEDGYGWKHLDRFKERCRTWAVSGNPALDGMDGWPAGLATPTWMNGTGIVHGSWVRRNGKGEINGTEEEAIEGQAAGYNLTAIAPGIGWMSTHGEWGRNVTGSEGKITMKVEDRRSEDHWYKDAEEKDKIMVSGVEEHRSPEAGQKLGAGLARDIRASVTLEDVHGTGSTYDMRLHGVFWPRQGAMLLTTTSEKFAGIFALPHLSLDKHFFKSGQRLLNRTLDEALTKREASRFLDPSGPFSSHAEGAQEGWNPIPHCEYVMFAQIHPLNAQQQRITYNGWRSSERQAELVKQIEEELRFPTGARVRGVPELQMSTVIFSPDCAYFLESKGPPDFAPADGRHLIGVKEEVYLWQARFWLLAFAGVLAGQVYLFKRQMRETSTPSTLGRISFFTLSIMVMADGVIFAAASFWTLSASTTYLPSLMVMFGGFMTMMIGGNFLGQVFKAHEPERRAREREEQQQLAARLASEHATATTEPPTAPGNAAADAVRAAFASDSLPRPVTAGPPRSDTPPIIIPSDQDISAEIAAQTAASGAATRPRHLPLPGTASPATAGTPANPQLTFSSIVGRFIVIDLFLLFLSIAATSWWASVRSAYTNIIAFIYFSFWVPQIIRNIERNSRRAFSWQFAVGHSTLRLAPFAYFYLRKDNIIFATPDPKSFAVLTLWLWIQLWILAFQDALGPRFGIPKSWTPEAWDYHPVLREDTLEAGGLPIGLAPSASAPGTPRLAPLSPGDEAEKSTPTARPGSRGGEVERKEREKHKGLRIRHIDCAICREVLEVPVVRAGETEDPPALAGVAGVFARRLYMVTPCRHVFHSSCLEEWLRFRLQCPICREDLPPL